MKQNKKSLLLIAGMSVIAASGAWAKPPGFGNHGTDIVHLFETITMVNTGVETNAAGIVEADRNAQGHADNQFLNISVDGLAPDTTYDLFALVGGSADLTDVTQFTTDTNGSANVTFTSKANGKSNNGKGHGNGNGNGNGNGHGKGHGAPLPGAINPISDLVALDIGTIVAGDSNTFTTNIVLTADFTSPDKLQYLIKRDMSNTNGVSALLQIKATTSKASFRLNASGLAASTDYLLAFNGDVVQTNTSDTNGNLSITSAPLPANILDLRSVALWDTSSNVVISATLP